MPSPKSLAVPLLLGVFALSTLSGCILHPRHHRHVSRRHKSCVHVWHNGYCSKCRFKRAVRVGAAVCAHIWHNGTCNKCRATKVISPAPHVHLYVSNRCTKCNHWRRPSQNNGVGNGNVPPGHRQTPPGHSNGRGRGHDNAPGHSNGRGNGRGRGRGHHKDPKVKISGGVKVEIKS